MCKKMFLSLISLYYPESYFSDITEEISWTILVYPDMDQDLGLDLGIVCG